MHRVRSRLFHACAATCGRSVGLVGLPNVGKSTLFNCVVRSSLAAASNFPFCTIEPNVALAPAPDPRLDALARLAGAARTVYVSLEVHDIAGLVAGASKGEGLGNAFLGDIRATHAIVHVVRCFEGGDVIHVLSHADPARDVAIIDNELMLADLQSVEKRVAGTRRLAARSADAAVTLRLLEAAGELLADGVPARAMASRVSRADAGAWAKLGLLTQKPVVYVANVDEDGARDGGNALTRTLARFLAERSEAEAGGAAAAPARAAAPPVVAVVCAQLEAELALVTDAGERAELLESFGLECSGVEAVLGGCSRALGLHVYYTNGADEARAWPIPVGATAQEAAGEIHSDFSDKFVKAMVTSYKDYVEAGGEQAARAASLTRTEGRGYVVADGDVIEFETR